MPAPCQMLRRLAKDIGPFCTEMKRITAPSGANAA